MRATHCMPARRVQLAACAPAARRSRARANPRASSETLGRMGDSVLRQSFLSDVVDSSHGRSRHGTNGASAAVKFCMLALGVSAFPICETLLLQTTMFATCFRWGPRFYGGSTLALFLPGFAVQVLQNRRDAATELIVGSRLFASLRLLVGHSVQLGMLCLFFGLLHGDPDRWEGNDDFLAVSFLVIGCCCAVVYGTCAQTVSLFPSEAHPWFFVGCVMWPAHLFLALRLPAFRCTSKHNLRPSTCFCFDRTYSVSIAIAPLNVVTGELCDEARGKPYWDRIIAFYSTSSAFQLAGLVAFAVLAYSGVGGADAFSKKDAQLQRAVVATPRTKRPADRGWIVPRSSDGRIPGSPGQRPEREPEQSSDKQLVDPNHRHSLVRNHSLVQIWRKSAYVAATMAISLVQNLLVCGLFCRLRVQGDLPALRTTMLYSFYISQCIGTVVVMVS